MKKQWTIEDSSELYRIKNWGQGFFDINKKGHLIVKPSSSSPKFVDLHCLIEELRKRKIDPPVLIRFMDILHERIRQIHDCFQNAISEYNYKGSYHPIFPIKVNQQRHVLEGILEHGEKFNIGLEAGSKAELLTVLALSKNGNIPLICNGYKDQEFIELVAMAHKMGKRIFPVIEKFSELTGFIKLYKKTGIMPNLGIRIKLAQKGAGQWAQSGGDTSKFGLRVSEVVEAVKLLKKENLLPYLTLLHFHIGSQIPRINIIKRALTETARVYSELLAAGADIKYIDVGGGLGLDYSGQDRNSSSSLNYTVQEYANDVIYRIQQVCDQSEIPHPHIFSESGRFVSAHYSVLVTNISGTSRIVSDQLPTKPEDTPGPMTELYEVIDVLNNRNYMECYHDAIQYRTEALHLFNLGYMTLEQRGIMEKVYWGIMKKIQTILGHLKNPPEELGSIRKELADTYFANFSVFQSIPDSWALKQLFPTIPVHRLNEKPTVDAVIVDLTCDSDGKITDYIGYGEQNSTLSVHPINQDEDYYLGIFLIGAYQETLGEMHNLFGDTNAVQVDITGRGTYEISHYIKGDTVREVLEFISFSTAELIERMREQVESAVSGKRLTLEESANMMGLFEYGLNSLTYLEDFNSTK